MKCPKCGYENGPDALACGLCAEVLRAKPTTPAAQGKGGAEPSSDGSGEPNWAAMGPPAGPPHCWKCGKMNYLIPKACACCLGPYQDELGVTATVTRNDGDQQVTYTTTWNFLYCLDCSAHIKGSQTGWLIAIGAGLLAAIGYMVLAWQGQTRPGAGGHGTTHYLDGTNWGIAIAVLAVILGIVKVICLQCFPKMGPRCASLGLPVRVSGPHAGQYKWTFDHPAYGQAFEEMNDF